MTKFAVYVVKVEDTEENDMAFLDLPAESFDRIDGDLDADLADDIYQQAKDLAYPPSWKQAPRG